MTLSPTEVQAARERVRQYISRLRISASHRADDEDISNDADLGRRAIALRSDLTLILGLLDRAAEVVEPFGKFPKTPWRLPDDSILEVSHFNQESWRREARVGLRVGHFRRATYLHKLLGASPHTGTDNAD